jgi:dihydrofolate reductase
MSSAMSAGTGLVSVSASVSLDGFIAGPEGSGFEHLFAWYEGGDRTFPSTHPEIPFHLSGADHDYLTAAMARMGVLVVGRRLFDITNGWDGVHPLDKPVVVMTHRTPQDWVERYPDAPFEFVPTGIHDAVAAAHDLAGGLDVGLNAGEVASQGIAAGLVDEVILDLVPVLLGGGTRFFDAIGTTPVVLDGPEATQGHRVTHLRYTVRRDRV